MPWDPYTAPAAERPANGTSPLVMAGFVLVAILAILVAPLLQVVLHLVVAPVFLICDLLALCVARLNHASESSSESDPGPQRGIRDTMTYPKTN